MRARKPASWRQLRRPDQRDALAVVYVVAFWAIFTGLLEIVAAIRLRDMINTEWLVGLSGALSIVFGILVAAQPASGALTIVYLFGFYAILAGISQISFGVRLRSLNQSVQTRAHRPVDVALAWRRCLSARHHVGRTAAPALHSVIRLKRSLSRHS